MHACSRARADNSIRSAEPEAECTRANAAIAPRDHYVAVLRGMNERDPRIFPLLTGRDAGRGRKREKKRTGTSGGACASAPVNRANWNAVESDVDVALKRTGRR